MKKRFWIAAITATSLNGAGSVAAEHPTFEIMGLPITAHQVALVGSGHVEERSPTPTLTMAGMPASPHQVAVLTSRSRIVEEANLKKDSLSVR